MTEKVLRVGLGLFGSGFIVAVFENYFLQSDLGSVFRFEASRDQSSRARRETFRVGQQRRRTVHRTIVVLELVCGQPVIGAFGFLVGQQGGDRKSPTALGTCPTRQALVRHPRKPSAHGSPHLL